jgi:SAM-dependent methyltransferase
MAQALGKCGFCVTGIDSSPEMLRLARESAPGAEFILADVCSFSLPRIFLGALSTFNSLAHLHTTQDLLSAFSCIRSALMPNGNFLFDLSMEAAYSSKWKGLIRYEDRDCVCTIEPSYDTKHHIGLNRVTLTHGGQRAHFCIEQKCHTEDELRSALRTSGFEMVQTFDAQRDLGMAGELGRTFFLCT